MILFKKQYRELIRCGSKTTTIRLWKSRRVTPGKTYQCPFLGKLEILDAREISPDDIDDAIARSDGFDSASELRKEIAALYPPTQRDGRILLLITFRYLGA